MAMQSDIPLLRRRSILGGGAALAAAGIAAGRAGAAPATPAGEIAIVMNSAGASISIVDMARHRQIREMPVLREPHHWTLSPDGTELWVGDAGGNAMFALDPTTGTPLGHRVLADPYQLWVFEAVAADWAQRNGYTPAPSADLAGSDVKRVSVSAKKRSASRPR